jgi:hypothetical protein
VLIAQVMKATASRADSARIACSFCIGRQSAGTLDPRAID